MKIQESAENYLETILMLSETKHDVRSIDIATEMEFTKPSVSVAMKKLRENGYIHMDTDGYITLTESGKIVAERTYERHKFLSKFLTDIGVNHEVAAEDACRIEHVISAESFEKLKTFVKMTSTELDNQVE
ncbi:metal-dependent transcriptional regulator [Scatolibacter rhodanostii]|uniref:metal-dependent transcriptional regulator n=1 Tax=Scatolibacter rhodanostii TaxID=2014781 RepID=UPI000C07BCE9|nr:metal-dependent transcriptional regulator [Scatolibacter rhodanostii]